MAPVVFVMTDVVGSTALWEAHGDAMRRSLEVHDDVLARAMSGAGGRVFKHTGDGMIAAFGDADSVDWSIASAAYLEARDGDPAVAAALIEFAEGLDTLALTPDSLPRARTVLEQRDDGVAVDPPRALTRAEATEITRRSLHERAHAATLP